MENIIGLALMGLLVLCIFAYLSFRYIELFHELNRLKEQINSIKKEKVEPKEFRDLRFKVGALNEKISELYKFKVIYKRKGFFIGKSELEEKYFFNEEDAERFMMQENITEPVLIDLVDL
jgi:hypothetical protein